MKPLTEIKLQKLGSKSDIPKLSEAQNEMCSQLGASQLGTKRDSEKVSSSNGLLLELQNEMA